MMSINSGHTRRYRRPTRDTLDPLGRAILQLETMINERRFNALPVPFDLHKAKRILKGFQQSDSDVRPTSP